MKNLFILSIFSIVFLISSCTKDNNVVDTPDDDISIPTLRVAQGYTAGTKIELYSYDSLRTGYNQLFIRLTDSVSHSVIRDAHLELTPMMDMGISQHSCPTEQTQSDKITKDFYDAAAIFTMAETSTYKWSITAKIRNNLNNKEGQISIPISVTQGQHPSSTFSASDGNAMVAAMIPMAKPKVGLNDVEFVIYTNTDNGFIPVEDVTTVITPEMPSMGHGSPNNVNPVSKGKGHYSGKVNFIMTGEWKINLEIARAGTKLGKPFFWITL